MGGRHLFICSCSAQLISFKIDYLKGLYGYRGTCLPNYQAGYSAKCYTLSNSLNISECIALSLPSSH